MRYSFNASVVVAVLLFQTPALAEITILGEDPSIVDEDPGFYKPGKRLPDNYSFDVKECETIVVFDGRRLVRVEGPHKGPLSAYKEGQGYCHMNFEAMGERQSAYEFYFHKVCEKVKKCDEVCRMAFKSIEKKDKDKLSLKCD
jgi:hypothetical protein